MKKLLTVKIALVLILTLSISACAFGGNSGSDINVSNTGRTSTAGWDRITGDFTGHLYSIWGNSSSDIFAVGGGPGDGVIVHYDGDTWSQMDSPSIASLRGVWSSSSSDAYATGGPDGTILHYDGTSWTKMNSGFTEGYIYGIWGSSACDVYAVGIHTGVLNYNGVD